MTLAGLATRNIWRNTVRTLLTILGVGVTLVTFILIRTTIEAWYVGIDSAQVDRLVTRHKVTFVMTLPKRYIDTVRETPGIGKSTWANWFGGKDPKHDGEFFATLAVDSASFFDVYNEMKVTPAELTAFKENRQAMIVGDALATKMGWKVGDKVTLESGIYPTPPDNPWTFIVVGIYEATAKSIDRSTVVIHWSLVNDRMPEYRKDQIGWIVSRKSSSSASAAELAVAIDKVFDEKEIQTLSQDERSFQASFMAMFSSVLTAMNYVSLAILAIMMLILGNTIAMAVRERTQEYGVLRVLGFTPRHIAFFVLGEAAFTGFLGGLCALGLAYGLITLWMGPLVESNMGSMFPFFRVSAITAAGTFLLGIFLGIASSALPAFQASRVKVTDALRRVA